MIAYIPSNHPLLIASARAHVLTWLADDAAAYHAAMADRIYSIYVTVETIAQERVSLLPDDVNARIVLMAATKEERNIWRTYHSEAPIALQAYWAYRYMLHSWLARHPHST